MTNNPARPMRSWGDVNAALNGFVSKGVIEGFRTNRDAKNADPAIVLKIRETAKESFVIHLVRDALTGAFADTELSIEVAE